MFITTLFTNFQKSGSRVSCKYILFLLRYVLQIDKSDELLKNWYFSDDRAEDWIAITQSTQLTNRTFRKTKNAVVVSITCRNTIKIFPLKSTTKGQPYMDEANWGVKFPGQYYKAAIRVGILYLKTEGLLIVLLN